jgi:serine/threonine-protein kinase
VADFTESIRQSPQAPLGYNLRAAARYQLGEYRTAIQDHLEALKRDPRDPGTFNQLAWIWATAPDPDVRNGERAKECATRACELTEWQEAGYLDTLAAACAECGEHDVAVQWQQKALDRARPEQMAEYTARLVLYVDGKPYRARPGQSDS